VILGFTGTRDGLTDKQKMALMKEVLLDHEHEGIEEAHHGACVGADHQFHDLLVWLIGKHRLILHPPTNQSMMPVLLMRWPEAQRKKPLPYLERNKAIVRTCDRLIACPAQADEIQRSGTWATVRYARIMGRKITLLTP
jgi:hypothetical protein